MKTDDEKLRLTPSKKGGKSYDSGSPKPDTLSSGRTTPGVEDNSRCSTVWQVAITFICFLAHFMESFGSHGFVILIAKAYVDRLVPLWLMGVMAVIPVLLALLLLPHLIFLFQKSPMMYRISGFLGFLFLGVSFLSSAFVPQQFYLLVSYSLPFGIGSAALLACTSQLINSYFPKKTICQRVSSFLIAMGFPLGAILGFFIYSLAFSTNFSLFWFLVSVAIVNFVCAIVLGIFMKPREQSFFTLRCCLSEQEKKERRMSRMEIENPCASFLALGKCGRRHLMLFWLFAEVVCGTFWFSLRTNLVVYFMMTAGKTISQASLFMCAFGAGQTIVILFALLLGGYLRSTLPIIHLISAMGLCGCSGVILFLPLTDGPRYGVAAALGFCVQLSLSFTYPNAEKLMKIGFGRSFVLTAASLSIGVGLSVVFGGVILDFLLPADNFFWAQLGGWGLLTILHFIICVLYYLFKIVK